MTLFFSTGACIPGSRSRGTAREGATTVAQPSNFECGSVLQMDPQQAILELRQYTLHPGARDTLIELFDREFIAPQEDAGMSILGQFRVLDDPDKFFWIRGFTDMETRAVALAAFYGGPVWKANSAAANATMVDSDDVLLMRPARPSSAFKIETAENALYVANVLYFSGCDESDFIATFEQRLAPVATRAGANVRAYFVSQHSVNTFPALPVREDEHAFVWFASFAGMEAYDRYNALLNADPDWQRALETGTGSLRNVETKRLIPTSGSRLR